MNEHVVNVFYAHPAKVMLKELRKELDGAIASLEKIGCRGIFVFFDDKTRAFVNEQNAWVFFEDTQPHLEQAHIAVFESDWESYPECIARMDHVKAIGTISIIILPKKD